MTESGKHDGSRRSRWRESNVPDRLTLVPGQVVIPNIRLIKQIAAGGMGSIWQAEHLSLKSDVAVKFALSEHRENDAASTRFEGEALASARLRSPHIVQVLDQGVSDGLRYIVMELLEGEDLESRLERDPKLPLALVATIVAQAAKGLSKAHQLGVIHRDIKPSNIFLIDSDGEPFVKILDFGIAKLSLDHVVNLRVTQTGAVIGTPAFMAPEQMTHAKDVGPAADMWSLGVVAFFALAGRLPYESDTLAGLAMAIAGGEFPDISSLVPGLPKGLDGFFERALARDPQLRFASTRAMAESFLEIAKVAAPASAITSAPPPPLDDDATEVSTPSSLDDIERAARSEPSPEPAGARTHGSVDRSHGAPSSEPVTRSAASAPVERVSTAADARVVGGTGNTMSDVASSVPDEPAPPRRSRALLWFSLVAIGAGGAYGVIRLKNSDAVPPQGTVERVDSAAAVMTPPASTELAIESAPAPQPMASASASAASSASAAPPSSASAKPVVVVKPLPIKRPPVAPSASASAVPVAPSAPPTAAPSATP